MKRSEINVPTACGMDWESMKKGEKPARFCGDCQKHVHDLSSMTKAEASALLDSSETEGLCVRYLYDAEGNVVFGGTAAKKKLVEPTALTRFARAKRYVAAAVTLALPMSLNACMGAYQPPAARAVPKAEPVTSSTPVATDAGAVTAPAVTPPSTPVAK